MYYYIKRIKVKSRSVDLNRNLYSLIMILKAFKHTFLPKVAIPLQRGANFQFLDFGTPLEKSVSLTFSEQWLCHFSKGVSQWGVPAGRHSRGAPHACHVPEARRRIYIYIYI